MATLFATMINRVEVKVDRLEYRLSFLEESSSEMRATVDHIYLG